jgi:hypothetical protein
MTRRAGSLAARAALALGSVLLAPAAWAVPGDATWRLETGAAFIVTPELPGTELLRIDAATGNLGRLAVILTFLHSTGVENTFLGMNAGNLPVFVSGSQNTAAGTHALGSSQSGSQSSAFGFQAVRGSLASGNSGFGSEAMGGVMGYGAARNSAFGRDALRSIYSGVENAAFGDDALALNMAGSSNSAFGSSALHANTASGNSAFGREALLLNQEGTGNAAFGVAALAGNQAGEKNSAFGVGSLLHNVTGTQNSAFGPAALYSNTASDNSAFGMVALYQNIGGQENAAFGTVALHDNQSGSQNSAFGAGALRLNTAGTNSAFGYNALNANLDGIGNSALGHEALDAKESGDSTLAVGKAAGANQTTGDNNIYIGNAGTNGESNQIKLGTLLTHTAATIVGIHDNASDSGIPVLVNSSGVLGTNLSSSRFKRDIRDLGEAGSLLASLRPVTFRYRKDLVGESDSRILQYGLLAEEVAQVAPDLVQYDAEGRPHAVRYELLTPLLLSEVEENRRTLTALRARAEELETRVSAQSEASR